MIGVADRDMWQQCNREAWREVALACPLGSRDEQMNLWDVRRRDLYFERTGERVSWAVDSAPSDDLPLLWAGVLVRGYGLAVSEVESFAGRMVDAAKRMAPVCSGGITDPRAGRADRGAG